MTDGQLRLDDIVDDVETSAPLPPKGLSYVPEALSPDVERELLADIDRQPWMTSLSRRVQHYGWRYDYKARRIALDSYLGPLPSFLSAVTDLVTDVAGFNPDQAIINEYDPGQGIAPHVDCEPCFGPVVAMVGLGSDVQMDFAHRHSDATWSMHFKRRGLVVLAEDARFDWTHAIAKRKSDARYATTRNRRVSITFRRVLPGATDRRL